MLVVSGKTFGTGDTVSVDGKRFVDCVCTAVEFLRSLVAGGVTLPVINLIGFQPTVVAPDPGQGN